VNLAVLSRHHPLVPMERLIFPDFCEIGGYPREVEVTVNDPFPHVILATDDTPPTVMPIVRLQRFKFLIPRPKMEGGVLSSVVITLYAATREDALLAVIDGRLREAAPWVPKRLTAEWPAPAPPDPPAV